MEKKDHTKRGERQVGLANNHTELGSYLSVRGVGYIFPPNGKDMIEINDLIYKLGVVAHTYYPSTPGC